MLEDIFGKEATSCPGPQTPNPAGFESSFPPGLGGLGWPSTDIVFLRKYLICTSSQSAERVVSRSVNHAGVRARLAAAVAEIRQAIAPAGQWLASMGMNGRL